MKKLLSLLLFIFVITTSVVIAQGVTAQNLYEQDYATEASFRAINDDTIDEVFDKQTETTYFIRHIEYPNDGTMSSILVVFDPLSKSFVDAEVYAANGVEDEQNSLQKPCPVNKDSSCIHKQPNLLKNQTELRPKPRRSSRVKLADNF